MTTLPEALAALERLESLAHAWPGLSDNLKLDLATIRDQLVAAERELENRDRDWILAMGHALGLDSGFNVPIVPRVDPFKQLFAAIRARAKHAVQEGRG